MEQHLIISDIAARTGIEAHVLRYWEKELQLDIPRNELGHRYYLESHVDLFMKIHQLKEAGYQLKAIRKVIEPPSVRDNKVVPMPTLQTNEIPLVPTVPKGVPERENSVPGISPAAHNATNLQVVHPAETAVKSVHNDKMEQFSKILEGIMTDVLAKQEDVAVERLVGGISDKVIKQMDYLFRLQDELEDERFKRLDETIRDCQRTRLETATGKNNRKLFRSKKRQEK